MTAHQVVACVSLHPVGVFQRLCEFELPDDMKGMVAPTKRTRKTNLIGIYRIAPRLAQRMRGAPHLCVRSPRWIDSDI